MVRILAAGTLCVFMVGCVERAQKPVRATEADIKILTDQKKAQVEAAAKEAQRQVKDAADAEEKRIQAEAKAAEAAIEAQKAKAEATLKKQERHVEEQTSRIHQAVGSAQQAITGRSDSEAELAKERAQPRPAAEGVQITMKNGVVQLAGNAGSEQEKGQKAQIEERLKNVEGRCTCQWVQDQKNGPETPEKQEKPEAKSAN